MSGFPVGPHDASLLAAVHPADWENPQPAGRYDLLVLGAGTAGLVAAAGAAGLGARVALVERHLMGGDCLNVGCVPSKALLRAARAAADVRAAERFGVRLGGPVEVDFAAAMERLRRLRASLAPHDSAARFRSLGVDVFLGDGRFAGRDALEVRGRAGDRTLRFARALIATGAHPAVPEIPGLQQAGCLTNETVFDLVDRPARLAVLGGGPLGCELAQAFARLGSRVTIVQSAARLLPREDSDAAALLAAALARDGVQARLSATLERVERRGDVRVLHLRGGDVLQAEALLVAVGRSPQVQGLGLDAAGVACDPREGVCVDDRLRTSNPRIFAAGDVCSSRKFTHAADFLARTALRNALFAGRARASALLIPHCTYTDPEVAQVGPTEEEARAAGLRVRAFREDLAGVDRARLDGETEGFVKVLVREGGDRLVAATIVARHAGEMLPELTLALQTGVGLQRLGGVIHSYPTQAEAIRRLGDQWNRTRLTPRARRWLQRWLALRRG